MAPEGPVCGLGLPVSGSVVRKNIMEEKADSPYERQGQKKEQATDIICEETLSDFLLSSTPPPKVL